VGIDLVATVGVVTERVENLRQHEVGKIEVDFFGGNASTTQIDDCADWVRVLSIMVRHRYEAALLQCFGSARMFGAAFAHWQSSDPKQYFAANDGAGDNTINRRQTGIPASSGR
jgi:hypothetical protein